MVWQIVNFFMIPEVQNTGIRCLEEGTQKIINLYTHTALLLIACDVAAKSYEIREDNFQLSTTSLYLIFYGWGHLIASGFEEHSLMLQLS